jgi:hypothetical protein
LPANCFNIEKRAQSRANKYSKFEQQRMKNEEEEEENWSGKKNDNREIYANEQLFFSFSFNIISTSVDSSLISLSFHLTQHNLRRRRRKYGIKNQRDTANIEGTHRNPLLLST